MMIIEATYDPADDKLRLRASARLDAETYARVKGAGFDWAPKQRCFFAVWNPQREDLAIELAGELEDEGTTLAERAEARAERFEEYHERRAEESERATDAVNQLADGIPLGQPILVGHHSERHARRDAKRIENGMRKAVNLWKTSQYWERRAAGVLQHAERKERPDVVARRIKSLEADERKHAKAVADSEKFTKAWHRLDDPTFLKLKATGAPTTPLQKAVYLADCDWRVAHLSVSDIRDGKITPEQARDQALAAHEPTIAHHGRWLEHTRNRLAYERALLADAGGLPVDKTKPEVGGAIRCWCCKSFGMWMLIQKVNKVSVTVSDTWGHGDLFPRKIKLDEITGVMSAAEVAAKLAAGAAVKSDDGRCVFMQDTPPKPSKPEKDEKPADIAAMEASLRAGVQIAVAPQLFPTPPELALRMARTVRIPTGGRVLDPSAGTGNLLLAAREATYNSCLRIAVEIDRQLAARLDSTDRLVTAPVHCADFLQCTPETLGRFDVVLMNPPFNHGIDIDHIKHAVQFLEPGGRLVAICADGPQQQAELKPLASTWEELPEGTFAASGTHVRAVLLTIQR